MSKTKTNNTRRLIAMGLAAVCLTPALPQAEAAETAEAEPAAQDLGEVVVTAEKHPTQRLDTPENISVITAKEIADNHYQTLAEAAEHVNGVAITRMGGTDFVTLNGDQRVVVLVDGVRQNNDQGGSAGRYSMNINMLPSLKNVARIEIIKGGASALYGSDAVGGVINIITKKVYAPATTLSMSTGSWKTHAYELTTQGNAGDLQWQVGAAMDRRGYFAYKYGGDTHRMAHSDHNNEALDLNLRQQFGASASLQLAMQHKRIQADQYTCLGDTSMANPYSPHLDALANNISLSYRFREDSAAPGRLTYFNNYQTQMFGGRFQTRLQGFDYQDGWQIAPQQTLVAGAEWHQSSSSNRDSGYHDAQITTQAFYVQDTWKFAPKWNFVPGLRVDHHSKAGTHWSPKVALNYRADDATQLYASWGRVFKSPTADDLYYSTPYMHGNQNLRPESGWTASLGLNHSMSAGTSLSVNLFKSRLHDAIRWFMDGSYLWSPENLNLEDKHGLELTVKHQASPFWSFDAGYSYTHIEVDKGDGAGKQLDLTNRQPNGYRFGVHYKAGAWKANLLGLSGTGLSSGANRYADSRYLRWDLNVSYAPTDDLTIYAKALNLTNQHYPVYNSRYYPGDGRCFLLGMQYNF